MDVFSVHKKLVGKEIEIVLYDIDPISGEMLCNAAYDEGLRLQKIFNLFDPSSELSQLNSRRSVKASKELLEVTKKAIEFCRMSEGEYDISLGKQIKLRKEGKEEDASSKPAAGCSYKDILIKGNTITLQHPDIVVDLGSIAKGYIVDKIADFLQDEGVLSGLVDGRGDIRVFGDMPHQLAIQHPREKEKLAAMFALKDCGVATSGDYNQYNITFDRSHILNSKELISVTCIAPSLMVADAFATMIFVTEKKKRETLLKGHKNVKAFTIDKDMKITHYNGFETLLVK